MRRLLNTLYVTEKRQYLRLLNHNVVICDKNGEVGKIPLQNLEGIVAFEPSGATPNLMEECAKNNISLNFLSYTGKFTMRVTGEQKGNVLLRKTQYRVSDDAEASMEYARNFIIGKIYNEVMVVNRYRRDHAIQVDEIHMKQIRDDLKAIIAQCMTAKNVDSLRSLEGRAAEKYFAVFNDCILNQKSDFKFVNRNRRPPTDRLNAMLSYTYTLLTMMCTSALETVGLDPYVGFMHTDQPGRASLALDLVEELRSPYADRFVLSLINKRVIQGDDFSVTEDGSVLMKDGARKRFLGFWEKKKHEEITHPYLNEKVEWGLIPYVQAILLARTLRGDLEVYPPFMWH